MRSKLLTAALVATLGFLVATNPVIVDAAGQITSGQIKNNTIKSKDIKDNQIKSADVKDNVLTSADLKDGAVAISRPRPPRPRAPRWPATPSRRSHNFATEALLCADIPVTAAEVRSSQWSAGMEAGGIYFTIGNWGLGPSSEYRVSIEPDSGRACLYRASGPGETYSNIAFFQTSSTSTSAVPIIPRAQKRG